MLCAIGCGCDRTTHECREVTARTFEVIRIVDGDTFKIVYDGEETSVRIWGIDAPERREPGGPQSTAALTKLIEGRTVRLGFPGKRKRDNFGRLLATVRTDDVADIGGEMVRSGQAGRHQ